MSKRFQTTYSSTYFKCWGCGITKKKHLKAIWREQRQWFIMDPNNILSFLSVAKAKIPFGKQKID